MKFRQGETKEEEEEEETDRILEGGIAFGFLKVQGCATKLTGDTLLTFGLKAFLFVQEKTQKVCVCKGISVKFMADLN